jgi:KDO2-lipid IV(A) lauroyltransferase
MIQSWSDRVAFFGTWVGFKLGCLLANIFPRAWLYRFTDILASLGFHLFRGFRTRSIRNLIAAGGETWNLGPVHEIIRKSLQNFFRDFVEIAYALVVSSERLRAEIPFVGRQHLDTALAKGNGVIALGAHLGNFFLVGTRLATEGYGYTTWVMINQPRDSRFAQLMDDYRIKVRQKTIHARPRREALRQLGQVLGRNEIAVVIADEFRGNNGIHVPLFGRTVRARRGPATMALRTGAAVVPVYLIRDKSCGLKMIVEPELDLIRTDRGRNAVRENTLRITRWLETTVRAYPEQWNWMNIHWQGNVDSDDPVAKDQQVQTPNVLRTTKGDS